MAREAKPLFLASDNGAGVHPDVLEAIARANTGRAEAYGEDAWTKRVEALFRRHFGEQAETLLVFGGTGANVVALRTLAESYDAVLCAETAHIWRDECAAPEHFLGGKLVPIATPDGKLTPELLAPLLRGRGGVHRARPRVVSISQPTEWGTTYSVEELTSLADWVHEQGLVLHLDGARLANAAAFLGVPLGALGHEAGVDALSFGGTKNGLLAGEAVVLFDRALLERAAFLRKQATQLASKMRFLAAQLEAYLEGDLWLRNARHANAMACALGESVAQVPGVSLAQPVESNGVFVRLPRPAIRPLLERARFHLWDADAGIARWMTAWDTREEEVKAFAELLGEVVAREAGG